MSVDYLQVALRKAVFIREFEFGLLELLKSGQATGTLHTCVGQELTPALLERHLVPKQDAFFASHRGHGYYLAFGGDSTSLIAEITGREGALCGGKGGTQHLRQDTFYSNGIQGAGASQAVGFAWWSRFRGEAGIVVVQVGDGTFGEGSLYEALNLASLMRAPVLFLVEANGWAQSTNVSATTAGTFDMRATAFSIDVARCSDSNPEALSDALSMAVADVRGGKPFVQIVETQRLLAHSKGDDNRPEAYLSSIREADFLGKWMESEEGAQAKTSAADAVSRDISAVTKRPELSTSECSMSSKALLTAVPDLVHDSSGAVPCLFIESLNAGLRRSIEFDETVFLIGEDLADPYGGAFKAARGLSTMFPDRVVSSPISENGITGFAVGASLAGARPIVEIMFADFAYLASDQIINSAAKMKYMYNMTENLALVVRLVSGAGRGYGPTHSQSTELAFCGIPGLRVVAPSPKHDVEELLFQCATGCTSPIIFVEAKGLYSLPLNGAALEFMERVPQERDAESFPPLVFLPKDDKSRGTVVCYGEGALVAEKALWNVFIDTELCFDLVILTEISPLNLAAVRESVTRTGKLLVIDNSYSEYGFSSEVVAGLAMDHHSFLSWRLGPRFSPFPASATLEANMLVDVAKVEGVLREMGTVSDD